MEKIVPGASAMKPKSSSSSKKDQYLLKRRDPAPAEAAFAAHRQPQLPDAPLLAPPAAPAPTTLDNDGPPGFPLSGDPPTPPLPGSSIADEDFMMLQRRAAPVVEVPSPAAAAHLAQPTEGLAAAATKKTPKPKKPRKREREEAGDADAGADASPENAAGGGEPKKRKKKKKFIDLAAAMVQGDPSGLDLTQVLSEVRNLPLAPFHGADRRISDTARSFVLAFRSKYYKKSYENDPPEESRKMGLVDRPSAVAADGQSPKKKKLAAAAAARPAGVGSNDPTKAGVKRGPSDRQGEMAVKKKAKLDKIKTLASEKKAAAAGLGEQAVSAPQQQQQQQGARKDTKQGEMGKKKEAAAAARARTPSPTALMMKFPIKSTLPSVASLKARFARFGPLDVDGIRVYWKSHMCRVIYRFKADAEAALRYAKANAMFGQVDTQYHLREVESGAALPEALPPPQQQRSELRLMETASFRPGSSGNGAPLPMSRATGAVPARPAAVGQQQQPKSILKKSTTDEGNSGGTTTREGSRVKFMLDGADGGGKLDPPANVDSSGAPMVLAKAAKSVGFAASSQALQPPPTRALQPPMRPAFQQQQQPPRATQQLPTPPPLHLQQHHPYHHQPRVGGDGQPLVSPQSQMLAYPPPPRGHGDGPSALPGPPPPLPYQPRPTGGFPGGHQQQVGYPPRSSSGDSPPLLAGQQQQQFQPPRPSNANAATEEVPAWKRGEKEFKEEVWRLMTGIAKMVEPLTDKNGFFPYHLFRAQ